MSAIWIVPSSRADFGFWLAARGKMIRSGQDLVTRTTGKRNQDFQISANWDSVDLCITLTIRCFPLVSWWAAGQHPLQCESSPSGRVRLYSAPRWTRRRDFLQRFCRIALDGRWLRGKLNKKTPNRKRVCERIVFPTSSQRLPFWNREGLFWLPSRNRHDIRETGQVSNVWRIDKRKSNNKKKTVNFLFGLRWSNQVKVFFFLFGFLFVCVMDTLHSNWKESGTDNRKWRGRRGATAEKFPDLNFACGSRTRWPWQIS